MGIYIYVWYINRLPFLCVHASALFVRMFSTFYCMQLFTCLSNQGRCAHTQSRADTHTRKYRACTTNTHTPAALQPNEMYYTLWVYNTARNIHIILEYRARILRSTFIIHYVCAQVYSTTAISRGKSGAARPILRVKFNAAR